MQNQNGWVKIHRKITEWEWYDDLHCRVLLLHLILTCSYKQRRWRGIILEPGETVKSIYTLSDETGLSVQNVRTSIERLKSTLTLTQRQHGKHRILKLDRYSEYQDANTNPNTEVTPNQHQSNTKVTPNKEGKKERKKEYNTHSQTPAEKMKLFLLAHSDKNEMYQKLVSSLGQTSGLTVSKCSAELDKFVDYWTELNKSGKKMRWEQQKTFEVDKRIKTWFRNIGGFGTTKKRSGGIKRAS